MIEKSNCVSKVRVHASTQRLNRQLPWRAGYSHWNR